MKRILILHSSAGYGHIKAALALEKAFLKYHPDIHIRNINVLDFAPSFFKFFFDRGYNVLSSKLPFLWLQIYNHYNTMEHEGRFTRILFQIFLEKNFLVFLKNFNPDFILSTHPLPLQLISFTKQHDIINIPSANIPTDYGCHKFWISSDVNYYYVASDEVKSCLMNHGVREDKITASGIPISEEFLQTHEKEKLRKSLAIDPQCRVLLIVGGNIEKSSIEKIVQGIHRQHPHIFILIVCGRDFTLAKRLSSDRMNMNKKIKIFGFVDNFHDYMALSDLIITKAGGLTVSECLALGLPMVIYKVIPGQEEDNVNYLLKKQVVLRPASLNDLIKDVGALLGNDEKLSHMKNRSQNLGKPYAAQTIVNSIAEMLQR